MEFAIDDMDFWSPEGVTYPFRLMLLWKDVANVLPVDQIGGYADRKFARCATSGDNCAVVVFVKDDDWVWNVDANDRICVGLSP